MQILENELLSKHTYFRIGGPARFLAIPQSVEDLRDLAARITGSGLPWFVMGAGSNLLVSDQGFPGYVIKISRLNLGIDILNNARLITGCSVAISSLLRRCAQEGWGGLEFLTGVPGQIGGAVGMNAGTHLGETKDRLRRVEVFSFAQPDRMLEFAGADLRLEYRKNLFLPSGSIVYAAEWEITPGDPLEVKRVIDETLARRKATQPLDYPSCGSVFKNPRESGLQAWQVIDKLGLRGHRIGNAQIAEKHSNWILNLGGACAADVQALIDLVRTRARSELGIEMHPEVVRVG